MKAKLYHFNIVGDRGLQILQQYLAESDKPSNITWICLLRFTWRV